MTEAEQIVVLKKKLEDQDIRYYRIFDENKSIRDELRVIKMMAERNSKGWYLEYLQKSLSLIERQYEDLQDNFHKLNAKYNNEMKKRQYIFREKAEL